MTKIMTSEFSKNDNHDGKLRNCIDIIEVMVSRHVASKDAGRVVPPGRAKNTGEASGQNRSMRFGSRGCALG